MARGEHALALREAVLGGAHPDVATSLDWLGVHHLLRGNPAVAEPLLLRALAIQEAALAQNHPDIARTLTHLATLYLAQEMDTRAEPLHVRALSIREAAFSESHPLVAESLQHLADLYLERVAYARAEPLLLRALAIREAALGKHHPEVARTLHSLGRSYLEQGAFARAEPLLLRALAIREEALSKHHPDLAESLLRLTMLYETQGLSARARPFVAREQAVREAVLGQNPPNVAEAHLQLAWFYMRQGLFAGAEPAYERALAVQEAAVGKSHPLIARTLYQLALTLDLQGMYGRAEPLYERTLAIREAALGKSHFRLAEPSLKLGKLYLAQGLYARAEPLLLRAVSILQAALGEKSAAGGIALGALGTLYLEQGQYSRAEPLLRSSLAIRENFAGKNDPYVALALTQLGKLYQAQELYARAEPLLERALTVTEAAYGGNDPDVAEALYDLASLYSAQGKYGRARPLYERALVIRRAVFGGSHPRDAEVLNQLAVVHLARHRLAEALPLFTRAFALSERRLRQEALGLSDVHMAGFLQLLREDEERLYALLRAHPGNASVRRLALGAALLRKGRSVEESSNISRTIYQHLGAEDRRAFEQLRGLRTQLAQLSLQGPGGLRLPAHQQRLEELSAQSTALEADLAKRSAPLRALAELPPPAKIVDRVAAALPRDSALVEFITYVDRPLVLEPGAPGPQRPGELRYLALVLFPDATIRFRDLGPAEPMDSAALRLRDALANRDAAFQLLAQELYQRALQPLLPLLGKTRRLFVSPDGQLALVPFAALHDGQQFLVESFDFTYLPSGKHLLSRPQVEGPPGSVVVLADPDFSASLQTLALTRAEAPARTERSAALESFFSSLREAPAQRTWATAPLPGTRQEAEAIQRLLPQAQLFLGTEATKERLMQLETPGILHLATHGFFLEDASGPSGSRALGEIGELGQASEPPTPPDPLLRSGLLLAGARAPMPSGAVSPPESALVTALELAGLDLWGTQLVVLSACDTGRGDVRLGQGVYGLRRAFLVAGAETVVMSLWKVNDETTRELMEGYYANLLKGQGRATALREAMRELRHTQPHPHHWAPFIAMGQDMPLRWFKLGAR